MIDKLKQSIVTIQDHLFYNHPDLVITHFLEKYKYYLSKKISEAFNSTVAYGPFKGLKFSPDSSWNTSDHACMILGLYEKEILDSLTKISKKYNTLINLGAADGYYAIGVLVGGLFKNSYCFEMSENGRNLIQKNILLNKVSDRVTIYGVADKNFYKFIPEKQRSESVLLVDIEGDEFEIFDRDIFKMFKDSIIFIEIHDFLVSDGDVKLAKFKKDANEFFEITEYTTSARDPSKIPELARLSDIDRWLICSERRSRLMTWYKLTPK